MICEYRLREDQVADEEGVLHTVYGVEAWRHGEMVRCIPDVFFKKERAEHYIGLFNKLELRLIHLDDVIEEIL